MAEMKDVTIYTDGACLGNPGPGGYGVVLLHGGTQLSKVIALHKLDVLEQGFKTLAILVLTSERHSAESTPMVGPLQGYQSALGFASLAVARQSGKFDGAFDGLGAAIREESSVQSRELAEFFGQAPLKFVVVKI